MNSEPKPQDLSYLDFVKFDLRIGTIQSIEAVPKSKKLVKLEVSFGPVVGNRTILAGVAVPHAEGRVIVGQKVVAVLNLMPREMMGVMSHGMILASDDGSESDLPGGRGKVWLLGAGGPIPDGAEVG